MYFNAKTAGSGATRYFPTEYKDSSASSAIVLTNQKTITNLDGVVRWMKKQTLFNLKQRKGNCTHIYSNV